MTETIVENGVQLITNVHTTKATLTDKEALPEIQAKLGKRDLLPEKQVVDAGYVTAKQIVESREKHGIDLLGPMMRDPSPAGQKPKKASPALISRLIGKLNERRVRAANKAVTGDKRAPLIMR